MANHYTVFISPVQPLGIIHSMRLENSEPVSRREFIQLGLGALYILSGGVSVVDSYEKLADWQINPHTGCMEHEYENDTVCMTPYARENIWGVYNQNSQLTVETDYTWLNTHLARFAGAYLLILHGAKEFGSAFNKMLENSDLE